MTPRRVRPPAVLVGGILLLVGVVTAVAARASSPPDLPAIGADRLVASVVRALADRPPVSGKLLSHVDLGLPSLPDEGPHAPSGGPAAVLGYVNGDHRVRIWSSEDGVRLAELLPMGELDYFLSRREAWFWNSESFTAYHAGPFPAELPLDADPTTLFDLVDPLELARRSLAALSATTEVRVGTPTRVAGRACYALTLRPRSPETLVGRVEIDIDAEHRVPLRSAVFARGAGKPALSVGFTAVGFGPIDPRTYDFRPPGGARVERPTSNADEHAFGPDQPGSHDPSRHARVFGDGWGSMLALRTPSPNRLRGNGDGVDLLQFLPFSGPLFSIRLVGRGDHGWLLVGAVPQSRLAAVEFELP
jgi:hypothetical protein